MVHYVYTAQAAAHAAAHNLEPRPEGSPAFFGFDLINYQTAKAWQKLGYVRPASDETPPVICFPAAEWPGTSTPADLIRRFAKSAQLRLSYRCGSIRLHYHGARYDYDHIDRHGDFYMVFLSRA